MSEQINLRESSISSHQHSSRSRLSSISVSRSRSHENKSGKNNDSFNMINGCCRKCMKAFNKDGRSCLCQVPINERRKQMPPEGCSICGCQGCHPRDLKQKNQQQSGKNKQHTHNYSNSRDHEKKQRSSSKNDRPISPIDDQYISFQQYNLFNFGMSNMGQFLQQQLNIAPNLLGFGIPERIPSYILGRKS